MKDYSQDPRCVMTLDAGGTNFVFSARQGVREAVASFSLPAHGGDLQASLNNLLDGFRRVRENLSAAPAAISFAFPAPADYSQGVIVAPRNLPAYRMVPLRAFLEDAFGLPVFINNDGDLFAVGEASAGFLPYVNRLLAEAGSSKRYANLLGLTLGTGFGGGITSGGRLYRGDNSVGGEVWLLRHKYVAEWNAEEGASIRAVRRVYSQRSGLSETEAPEPKEIARIADGSAPGHRQAAQEAFRMLGEIAGDAAAQMDTLLDGLIVVGGGLAGAHRHFLPAMVQEMNGCWTAPDGERFRRLIPRVFNLEDEQDRAAFLRVEAVELPVPGSGRSIRFEWQQRTAVGVTRLGTSEAIAMGAYAFALAELDART